MKVENRAVPSRLPLSTERSIAVKITENPDAEIVRVVREGLKRTGGYCPCRREQITDPEFEGFCHCMLYYKAKGDKNE